MVICNPKKGMPLKGTPLVTVTQLPLVRLVVIWSIKFVPDDGQITTGRLLTVVMPMGGGTAVIIISPLAGSSGLLVPETSARIAIADKSMIEPPP